MQSLDRRSLAARRDVAEMVSRCVAAVRRDLRQIAKRDPELAKSGLAASALALAAELDDPDNSATAKAACARALTETLDRLRELVPPAVEQDRLDELAAARAARIA